MSEREININSAASSEQPEDFDLPLHPKPPLADTEEFRLHQERYRKVAEERNKSVIRKIRGKNIREVDIAHEEALRENADFDKRKHQEFKEWQRHLQVVIEHLKAKRDDPEGEGKKYRPLLLILGGGMRGPYAAGQGTALHKMGLRKSFDVVVGISAGSAVAGYFVAGEENGRKGTSLFYEEATHPEFINMRRVSQIMDARYMGKAMREGPKTLDQQAILDSSTELYVAVTRQENNQAELINTKTAKPGLVSAIEASTNVPLFRGAGIEVNETKYIDGGFDPLPLQQVIDKFHPTDILVLPNVPFDRLETFKSSSGMDFIAEHLPEAGSPGTIKKFLKITKELRGLLEDFKKERSVNIGILWPKDEGLTSTTTDADEIKSAIYEAGADTFRQFGEKPQPINLYESGKEEAYA